MNNKMKHPSTPVDAAAPTVLMADVAQRSGNVATFADPDKPMKRFWVHGWKQPGDWLEWVVESPSAQRVEVSVLTKGATAISLTWPSGKLQAELPPNDYQRTMIGSLLLPAGRSTLRAVLTSLPGKELEFRSVELMPEAAKSDFQKRAASLRSDTRWLRDAKYGAMFQWGSWGYPEHGPAKPWPRMIDDFDVGTFARMVDEEFGAGYVLWSITWRGSKFSAPLKSVERIVPGQTCSRDLIGDLAKALNKRGIKLMLYYHPGHEDRKWWTANWVSNDEKTKFFAQWCEVVPEIGTRYGDQLAGWFFDDGMVYYPAPFERLAKAAKAGYPQRLLSFNEWILPLTTEFQDVQFGEGFRGDSKTPIGGDGIYASGPMKGQQSHGMIMVDGPDWGIWQPETVITTMLSPGEALQIVRPMMERGQVLTLNLNMYEDGSISPQSRKVMETVRKEIRHR